MAVKKAEQVFTSQRVMEGAGFAVRRPFPSRGLPMVDPFLLLDEMGPAEHGPGEAQGAPDHPHRGFETVTYLLKGSMEHRDSAGNRGRLLPGDVQWMTAGAGVIHSEMPSREIMEKGGRLHGFQLWVNLPAAQKMIPPRYQDTPSSRIPVVTLDDGKSTVKVIAGDFRSARAVIETRTPILYWHARLQAGAELRHEIPAGFNVFAYVISGGGEFGAQGKIAGEGALIAFENAPGEISLRARPGGLQTLILGGKPLNEPVARYGPFVMNTPQEIAQAIEDFQAGRMGQITV